MCPRAAEKGSGLRARAERALIAADYNKMSRRHNRAWRLPGLALSLTARIVYSLLARRGGSRRARFSRGTRGARAGPGRALVGRHGLVSGLHLQRARGPGVLARPRRRRRAHALPDLL